MWITIAILVISAALFANGRIRSDIVALCALCALLVFQILTPAEALSGFSNSVVIMMVGLFVVGGAIFQTGLAKMISSRILKLAGKSETRLFLLVMLVTAGIGGFVSNTGTVALMLPIVVSLAASANLNASRLLMPLAFASSMGLFTLIATPPNLVIHEQLVSGGYEGLSFFSFFPVGIICVTVGTLVLLPLTKWFLSKKGGKDSKKGQQNKSLNELVKEYGLSDNLYRLKVVHTSLLKGKTIIDLDIRRQYGLNVIEVRRGVSSQHRFLKGTPPQQITSPRTQLQPDDLLYVRGPRENVERFVMVYQLEMQDANASQEKNKEGKVLDFYDVGMQKSS